MTLEEFVAKHAGKKVEFDGKYDFQCVDLVQQYNQDVIGAPPMSGNGKDYARNPRPSHYAYHNNDLWYIPPRGSIAVWNENVGDGFGHVAVVLEASLMSFVSFDQNWPDFAPPSVVKHNYRNVVCFLIPRKDEIVARYNALVDEVRRITKQFPKL